MKIRYKYSEFPNPDILKKVREVKHKLVYTYDDLTEDDKIFLSDVKVKIFEILGFECPIHLFGSRIKGNWDENSDYDLFIINFPNLDTQKKLKGLKFKYKLDIFFSESEEFGQFRTVKI